jgi:hypothetical protein
VIGQCPGSDLVSLNRVHWVLLSRVLTSILGQLNKNLGKGPIPLLVGQLEHACEDCEKLGDAGHAIHAVSVGLICPTGGICDFRRRIVVLQVCSGGIVQQNNPTENVTFSTPDKDSDAAV